MSQAQELAQEKFNSVLPFLPPLEEKTLSQYYWIYVGLVAAIITFGGLASPILEVKLGLGGEGPSLRRGGACASHAFASELTLWSLLHVVPSPSLLCRLLVH